MLTSPRAAASSRTLGWTKASSAKSKDSRAVVKSDRVWSENATSCGTWKGISLIWALNKAPASWTAVVSASLRPAEDQGMSEVKRGEMAWNRAQCLDPASIMKAKVLEGGRLRKQLESAVAIFNVWAG